MYAAAGSSMAGAMAAEQTSTQATTMTSPADFTTSLGVDFAGANGIALMVAGHMTDYANRADCYKR